MLSKIFLIRQGQCCGHGCVMCPYIPKHSIYTTKINVDIFKELENWEIKELENDIDFISINKKIGME